MALKEKLKALYHNEELSEKDLQIMELQTIQFFGILTREYFKNKTEFTK